MAQHAAAADIEGRMLAAANDAAPVVELDPWHVLSGGCDDRLVVDPEDVEGLASSILEVGQIVPIMVRPHRNLSARYEIVAGWRRLLACRLAGVGVRAIVHRLEDGHAAVAQAAENVARSNLSYIERARLAARLVDGMGFEASAVDRVFACGRSDRSRYLKVGRGIPDDLVAAIGPAPGVGRPRWEKLTDALAGGEEAFARVRCRLAQESDTLAKKSSDARFSHVLSVALEAQPSNSTTTYEIAVGGEMIGTIKPVGTDVSLRLFDRNRGLAAWVCADPERAARHLLEAYAAAERD